MMGAVNFIIKPNPVSSADICAGGAVDLQKPA